MTNPRHILLTASLRHGVESKLDLNDEVVFFYHLSLEGNTGYPQAHSSRHDRYGSRELPGDTKSRSPEQSPFYTGQYLLCIHCRVESISRIDPMLTYFANKDLPRPVHG